jgi:uncharacterized MAPEG superfamily protein
MLLLKILIWSIIILIFLFFIVGGIASCMLSSRISRNKERIFNKKINKIE